MESSHEGEPISRRAFLPGLAVMGGGVYATLASDAFAEQSPIPHMELLGIERDCLRYFLENQNECGLFLDRQRNRGDRYGAEGVPCSMSASGMGFIALALAAQKEHDLLPRENAMARCAHGMRTALQCLPQDHGIFPHFVRGARLEPWGEDTFSTVDSGWFIAGALCAAEILNDPCLRSLASELYRRVHWRYWTNGNGCQISQGKNRKGEFLCLWDRQSNETAFLYALAAGASGGRAIAPGAWTSLNPYIGEAQGLKFASADLGLFVHHLGSVLLDPHVWRHPQAINLAEHARIATRANILSCLDEAGGSQTMDPFWCRSAGDGPGQSGGQDTYRDYTLQRHDGTANVMTAIAAIEYEQVAVMQAICAAERAGLRGRYGFSNVNRLQSWIGSDAVGIDVGNAGLAIDNFQYHNRVRKSFEALLQVQQGLRRMGFRRSGFVAGDNHDDVHRADTDNIEASCSKVISRRRFLLLRRARR